MDEVMARAVREVESWPLWKLSYDVRDELAKLHNLTVPADTNITVGEWIHGR